MKTLKMTIFILLAILIVSLSSCDNFSKVNSKDVKKIHELIEELQVFEDANTYLTNFGQIYALETDEAYRLEILNSESKNGVYEYKKQENILYKDNEKIEENSLSSLDEFVKYIVSFIDSNFYCVSINEFIPFIKEVFLNTNDFKHSVIHAGKIFYSCETKGKIILNNEKFLSLLEKIDKENPIKDDDSINLALLFAKDFSKIYPEFELSINDRLVFSFNKKYN